MTTQTQHCQECNKKITLYGFTCKCGILTCDKHRHNHKCNYDYYKSNVKFLEKNMHLVVSEKIAKI
jgi:hypothetical protein